MTPVVWNSGFHQSKLPQAKLIVKETLLNQSLKGNALRPVVMDWSLISSWGLGAAVNGDGGVSSFYMPQQIGLRLSNDFRESGVTQNKNLLKDKFKMHQSLSKVSKSIKTFKGFFSFSLSKPKNTYCSIFIL